MCRMKQFLILLTDEPVGEPDEEGDTENVNETSEGVSTKILVGARTQNILTCLGWVYRAPLFPVAS